MPALVPAATSLGRRAWSSTWATVRQLAAGEDLHGRAGRKVPVATRPQNTRRPWLVSDEEENFSTHCTGKAGASAVSGGVLGSRSSTLQQAGAGVAAPAVHGPRPRSSP